MDLQQARFNMIEQQIRPWDVLDPNVLELMEEIPREEFVPEEFKQLAYADISIALGNGEFMTPPKIAARMLQTVGIRPNDTALEIGTGSGYVTALMAKMARHVYSVDINHDCIEMAKQNLATQNINNVTLEQGDAANGWHQNDHYDVIVITGSLPVLPDAFWQLLNRGGRLFAVIGNGPVMEAILVRRTGEKEFSKEVLFETELPMLQNASGTSQFVF